MSKASELARRLGAKSEGVGRWRCACPVHGGKNKNFVIAEGSKRDIVCQCFSKNCTWTEISAWIEREHPDLGLKKNGIGTSYHIYPSNGFVVRSGAGKDKKIYQEMPEKNSLYELYASPLFLANLENYSEVFIVEGEKSADAVRALGIENVVTWRGGASNPHKSDWSIIKDKLCYLWRDNDNQGQEAMQKVRAFLQKTKLVKIPDEIKDISKSDVFDFIELGKTAEEVRQAFLNVEKKEIKKAKIDLEEDYFLNAPGLVGKMTRELCKYGPQPYPSFAFAASACLVGALKGCWQRIEGYNLPPTIYAFCFAETGRGKDFARSKLITVLSRAKLSLYAMQKFRSAQGIHFDISRSSGTKVILHDEAHHFFVGMQNSRENFLHAIKPLLLELFTSHSNPNFDAGQVVSSADLQPLIYPSVSYCGFGVPQGLEGAFSDQSLVEGFLPRFLIFEESRDVLPLDISRVEPDSFDFEKSKEFLDLVENVQHHTALRDNFKSSPLMFELEKIKVNQAARELFFKYSLEIAKRRNADPVDDKIFSRAVEIAIRLSGSLAGGEITELEASYSIKLVDKVLGYTKDRASHTIQSKAYQMSEYVLDKLSDFPGGATARELLRCTRKIKSSKELKNILQDLCDDAKIRAMKVQNSTAKEIIKFSVC